jgi:hypothetical protein
MIVLSSDPLTINLLLYEKLFYLTVEVCLSKINIHLTFSTSHNLIVLSWDALSMNLLSQQNFTTQIYYLCPSKDLI